MGIITIITNPPPASASPDLRRRIPEQYLQKLRNHQRGAEQHDAQHEGEKHGRREIAPLEQTDIHDRIGVMPLPDNPNHESIDGRNRPGR